MSVLRDLAVFLVSAIFTFSLFMAITSYTLGNSLQKENLKEFIESGLAPDLMEDQCEEYCVNFTEEQKEACIQLCMDQIGNKTEESVSKVIDDVYEKSFYGVTINQLANLLNQFILFFVLSIVSAALIVIVSEEPLGHIGKNLITISISLFIASFSPSLIMSFSNLPVEEMVSDYLGQGLEQQTLFATIFIITGIALIIANYFLKRRKKKKAKKK